MSIIGQEKKLNEDSKKTIIPAFIATMCLCSLVALILIPITLRHLKGVRRVFIVMQQIFLIGHHIFLILPRLVYEKDIADELANIYHNASSWRDTLSHEVFKACKDFMYFQYYFMCMMHSIDMHMMICHPLTYSEFTSIKSMAKYFLCGTGVCLVLVADSFVMIFIELYLLKHWAYSTNVYLLKKAMTGFATFKVIKMIALKTVYTIVILKMAMKTKAGLDESMNMNMNARKQSLHKRLFYFTLIPILLNFLFFAHEILDLDFVFFQ